MAKRRKQAVDAGTQQESAARTEAPASSQVEETIGNFAEDLGKLLGTAQSKAASWLDQRKSIADQLAQIRDTANHYLTQLTGGSGGAVDSRTSGKRRGRPPGSGRQKASPAPAAAVKGTRKRKGGMSPEGRARVAEAQRARWAKVRAGRGADK